MKHLMGVKGCHQCVKRSDCKRKDKKPSLLKKPKTFKKIVSPKIYGVRVPTTIEVSSYCRSFELVKHTSTRR